MVDTFFTHVSGRWPIAKIRRTSAIYRMTFVYTWPLLKHELTHVDAPPLPLRRVSFKPISLSQKLNSEFIQLIIRTIYIKYSKVTII